MDTSTKLRVSNQYILRNRCVLPLVVNALIRCMHSVLHIVGECFHP